LLKESGHFGVCLLPGLSGLKAIVKQSLPLPAESTDAQKPASIYDVAKRAGVSIKTVRASSIASRTSAKNANGVLEMVDSLSYGPNVFARGLASERPSHRPSLHNPSQAMSPRCSSACSRAAARKLPYDRRGARCTEPEPRHQVHSLVTESFARRHPDSALVRHAGAIEALNRARTPFVRIAPRSRWRDRRTSGSTTTKRLTT